MSQFSSDKPQVFIPPAFEDFRGYLSVPYDRDVPFQVCQINQGYSREAFTLRGLHFQMGEYAQAKMVSCLHGSIFNVAVDLRPGKCFGYSYSEVLSFENRKMMYIPKGFAHGYLTLEDDTLMQCSQEENCSPTCIFPNIHDIECSTPVCCTVHEINRVTNRTHIYKN